MSDERVMQEGHVEFQGSKPFYLGTAQKAGAAKWFKSL